MTDQEAWPNSVRLAGAEVCFAEFTVGARPAYDVNEEAEATLAALGDGGRSRLLRLVQAVQTGVEAGVVRREHVRAIAAAVGGTEVAEVTPGDEKINDEAARSLSSSGEIAAAWWVLIHEESVCHDNIAWSTAAEAVSTRIRPEARRRVEALVTSLKVSGMVKG